MIAVVQRVLKSSVTVKDKTVGTIEAGLTVLLGVGKNDTLKDAKYLADKIVNLRIFEDSNGKMNLSLAETGGSMLVVSQFTLLGDCRKGRRPSFMQAAAPDKAETLYLHFIRLVKEKGIDTQTGIFQKMMEVSILNHGPVTIILESG